MEPVELSRVMEEMLAPYAPASVAWQARVHHTLSRRFPDRYVFRIYEDLEDLHAWLRCAIGDRFRAEIFNCLSYDEDRESAKVTPEGGWLELVWEQRPYLIVSFRAHTTRYPHTFSWGVCGCREEAEALINAVGRHSRNHRARVMVFSDGDWEEAPRLELGLRSYSWSSIILPPSTRDRVQRSAELFFASEQLYRDLEIPWKLGFLLVGPPGTGKTLATKVLASTCEVPFLYVRGLQCFSDRHLDANTLRTMFQGARERGPCILCLEEVDSLIPEGLRSAFLNELDGIEEDYRGVLTVATTNHPERLDAALLHRPSRFDYRFEFPLPGDEERRRFIRMWTDRLYGLGFLDHPAEVTEPLVRPSRGMSHAYLKRVMVGTAMRMHLESERGDEAFTRISSEEVEDAARDRTAGRRAESLCSETVPAGRFGFQPD
jgi:DNA polymerase III delta prime subunit